MLMGLKWSKRVKIDNLLSSKLKNPKQKKKRIKFLLFYTFFKFGHFRDRKGISYFDTFLASPYNFLTSQD